MNAKELKNLIQELEKIEKPLSILDPKQGETKQKLINLLESIRDR